MKNIRLQVLQIILVLGVVSILFSFPSQLKAQKPSVFSNKPKSDPNDDEQLCKQGNMPLANDKFCNYYDLYQQNVDDNPSKAIEYRNRMIDLLKVQIDKYYDAHKNGRVTKTKWFQSVLDILGIGLAFTGNIVGGLRDKTVLAATSGAFQAGRNSANDRFQLLQQQILINKMNANRLDQWAKIIEKKQLGIEEFSWDNAKSELQQYLFRGSFNDALDSLVQNTGAQVQTAQTNLNNVLKAVSQASLTAKLKNFTDYIRPMNERAIKLDADIAVIGAAISSMAAGPAKVTKLAEAADLKAKKDSFLENYKNIWLAIKVGGDFDVIDQKIQAKYGAFPAVIGRYTTFLANFKNAPAVITADDYDFVLTKVNAVVGDDEDLNKKFLEILNTYKLP